MLLEPRAGLALVTAHGLSGAFAAGLCAWLLHLALEGRMPRLGDTCEIAAAMAIVAGFDDSERTLAGVERLYRAVAIGGVSRARLAAAAPRTAAGT